MSPAASCDVPDDHLGLWMVRRIHTHLLIDEEWTEWHHDGFTWWSHGLAQRFRFEGPIDLDGLPTWWISFETDALRVVRGEGDKITSGLGMLNRFSNMGAYATDRDRIVLRGRTYAMPESSEHRAQLLAGHAIIANATAHRNTSTLVKAFQSLGIEAEPNTSCHPLHGARTVPDDMLNVIERVYAPRGGAPIPDFVPADLDAARANLDAMGMWAVQDHDGGDVSALLFKEATQPGIPLARVTIETREPHPVLGNGLLVRTSIHGQQLQEGVSAYLASSRLADHLNGFEWTVRSAPPLISLGAWTPDATKESKWESVAFATFYPNASLVPTLASTLALDAVHRARLALDRMGVQHAPSGRRPGSLRA